MSTPRQPFRHCLFLPLFIILFSILAVGTGVMCPHQWNQCPYWGALDTNLPNRVFMGFSNIACMVCRSVYYLTTSSLQNNPLILSKPEPNWVKSTSYVLWPTTAGLNAYTNFDARVRVVHFWSGRKVCNNFYYVKCSTECCHFFHVCNYCSGAHAHTICPVFKSIGHRM